MLLKEVCTTAAEETAPPLRATAVRRTGAFELVGTAALGGVFLTAAVVAVVRWTELFFFFFVLVVGVPSKSAPDSNNAVKKFGKRRIVK